MDLTNRVVKFFKTEHAEQLEKRFFELNVLTGKTTEVISIQRVGSFWYGWYYVSGKDILEVAPKEEAKNGNVRRPRKKKVR